MPFPIQTPVPGELLRREFGLRGRLDVQLDQVIVPVVNVADLAQGAGIPVERTVVGRFSQVAVAGEQFVFQMVVPPNTLVKLRRLHIWSQTAASDFKVHHGNALAAAPANLAEIRFADGRLLTPEFINPVVFPTYGTAAVALGANYEEIYRCDVAAQAIDVDLSHTVVGANDSVSYGYWEMCCDVANQKVVGTLVWTEYVAG